MADDVRMAFDRRGRFETAILLPFHGLSSLSKAMLQRKMCRIGHIKRQRPG